MKRFWICLGFIISVGLLTRVLWFRSIPATTYIDEIAMLVDAKSVFATGHDMHGNNWYQVIYPSYGDYKQPVYIWLIVPLLWIFGTAHWVLRVPSLLAGLGTMVITPLIAMELWRWRYFKKDVRVSCKKWYAKYKWLGISALLVVAISPWSITFSRTGFEGHVAQFLLASGIYFLLLSARNRIWLVVSVGSIVLSTYAYFSVRFVAPIVFIAIAIMQMWQYWRSSSSNPIKDLFRPVLLWLILPMIAYLLLLMPMYSSKYYADANQFRLSTPSVLNSDQVVLEQNMLRQIAGNSIVDRVVFHRLYLQSKELFANYSDFLDFRFMFLDGDSNLRHGTGMYGLFLLPMLIPFIIGIYILSTKRKTIGLILIIWWLVAILPAAVPETTPHALRSINALVPLSIMIGIGFYSAAGYLINNKRQGIAMAWILWVIWSFLSFVYYYHNIYPQLARTYWSEREQVLANQALAMANKSNDISSIKFLKINPEIYLWLLGNQNYTQFPLENVVDNNFKLSSFGKYSFNYDYSNLTISDKSIVVMLDSDWQRLKTEQQFKIWEIFEYTSMDEDKYIVATVSP